MSIKNLSSVPALDGWFGDSPFVPPRSLVDLVDKLPENGLVVVALLCTLTPLYAIFGGWLDLVLILIFNSWNNRFVVSSASDLIWKLSITFTVWFVIQMLRLAYTNLTAINNGRNGLYLIPSRSTHTRIHPRKHQFSYSYLVCGIPVDFTGNSNGIISVDEDAATNSWFWPSWPSSAWYNVDSAEYLQRGSSDRGLRGKLDRYLVSQGANPTDYPYAFLVTAPKFLWYQFNPVSFWYLYSADKTLSAILLEVNNTFDERRAYLVLRDSETAGPTTETLDRMKGRWKKDFHLSPFSSRDGSYTMRSSDPLGRNMEGFQGIDVTINYLSSKGTPKVIGRLVSEGQHIEASDMSLFQKLRFVSAWFWVGFMTVPRIFHQAITLLLKRNLYVWFQPMPMKDTIARHADRTERKLEAIFRSYLGYLVEMSPSPVSVRYVPNGIVDKDEETFTSGVAKKNPDETEQVTIKVLTPEFYSRFVHYAHDFEAMFNELEENCTVWVDKPEALTKIFLKQKSPPLNAPSLTDFVHFKLIKSLRRLPKKIPRPSNSIQGVPEIEEPATKAVDIREFRISSMDTFVLERCDKQQRALYRATVARLFVANRFLAGNVGLLRLGEFFLHAGAAWWVVSTLSSR
ncbi:hypothetical protein PT974_11395 [Cladobotryum mycophilum]|uniref:Cyclopropane-fatty-acyl-phospholipid synthase n=1 Tax=Cladobotryum mycophilum TaxID=491253 RepID=A0ABR0S626_9HYPO